MLAAFFRGVARAACLSLIGAAAAQVAAACPFCTALGPTLCQLREQASIVALAEMDGDAGANRAHLRLHRALVGSPRLQGRETLDLPLDLAAKPGSLLLIFGTGGPDATLDELQWHAVAVTETSYAYFARAPRLQTPTAERLRYFAPLLEHAEGLIAEDAYLEFGHAPFDEVARVADVLPQARMRSWLADPKIPQARKGFYGLALGLARDAATRRTNAEFLRGLILAPEDDFRAGFDGILGGYLLLAAVPGLDLVESRYLANPRAADGDTRHALTALRFYHEFGHKIPPARLQSALGQLLKRPEFAAAAITDLARWKDWSITARIGALYDDKAFADPAIRRAIVGYLLACPGPEASQALARLRAADPQGVQAAEQILSRTSSTGPEAR